MRPPVDVLDLFLELTRIPSPSRDERAVADRCAAFLRGLGLDVREDEAGTRTGGNAGNLIASIPATAAGTPILLCAHMDTVPPRGPLEPVVEDGVVRNAGGTILGADNKATVAAMLVAVATILAEGRPHAGVDLVLTVQEELACLGAREVDLGRLAARAGFVFDDQGPVGGIVLGAPTQKQMEVVFRGKAAHAGMVPEEGRSAVLAAARAIVDLPPGRIDAETTCNVGLIDGGSARNIVPERCHLVAEARSHDDAKLDDVVREMLDTFSFAATTTDCSVDVSVVEAYHGYRFREDDPLVAAGAAALHRAGREPRYGTSGGGTDGNVFTAGGLRTLVLSSGMMEVHGPAEHIAVADVEAMVEVTLALVDEARDGALASAG